MKTKLITSVGYEKLKQEAEYLWKTERPEVTKIVAWAASLGDRSENADYQYNKRRLREIDRRVRFLRKTLEDITVVSTPPSDTTKVYFGAWVELENEKEEKLNFRIVGPEEIYHQNDYISIDAPIARACLQKTINDEVNVKTPNGERVWYIVNIQYENV
ncbi:transcription elongation factor GreB [Hydrogenovibrio marinus]|uniref:Transcription elongation factor GreB n=1 Tax=Hydrogenovibrio marinus TaxID=28885 RepID=A0A066ZTG7_HYDMR|nr:transcription elongation factor GreB [Hydrogenovibrio marinus]KDN96772.1 transcription elongation factor GreB [Hydrogenovibrio marinus]BBN59025.1 transcription elongation factor GreB [Hydrogenovibrio marinus]